jgi:hypothetical protein
MIKQSIQVHLGKYFQLFMILQITTQGAIFNNFQKIKYYDMGHFNVYR